MDFRWSIIQGYAPLFAKGVLMTLQVSLISILIGTVIGLLVGMLRLADVQHGPWKWPSNACAGWPASTSPSSVAHRCSCRSC
jgi:polar amino acid transport system permease protein